MSVMGIKVVVEEGIAELVDEQGRIAHYHVAGEAKGDFILHAVCDAISHGCSMKEALTAVAGFPEELFIHHPAPGPQPHFPLGVIQHWEGVFRYIRDEKEKLEEAKRTHVIEAEIELRVEQLGGDVSGKLWTDRKSGLRQMTIPELQHLSEGLQKIATSQAAISAVVKGITDSRHARQAAEDKKFNELDGGRPARMDM